MSIDPFKLPGLIEKRVVINPADISSSDDEGTSYALKSGKEKQKALREKERLRNLRAQAEGTKPSEPPAPAAHVPSADVTEVEPPPSASSNSSLSRGRQAEFRTRVHGNGNLLIGQAYTRRMGLEPGQEFRIELHRETGSIWLLPVEVQGQTS
jgi:hypothetical protein